MTAKMTHTMRAERANVIRRQQLASSLGACAQTNTANNPLTELGMQFANPVPQ